MTHIPESHLDILHATALAFIATIGPKGEPQVSPTWFGWDGTQLFFSMNKVRQKHRNLRREPRVAVAITDPTNPYRSLELRGVARVADDPTIVSPKSTHKSISTGSPRPTRTHPARSAWSSSWSHST